MTLCIHSYAGFYILRIVSDNYVKMMSIFYIFWYCGSIFLRPIDLVVELVRKENCRNENTCIKLQFSKTSTFRYMFCSRFCIVEAREKT